MTQQAELMEQVISDVADREGVPEDALPPLYDFVDFGAVEELFNHASSQSVTGLQVRFSYYGYNIAIREPGEVSVER